ncbi:MAG: hypothetical protein AAGK78_02915 [Planctomycetota bacterium]
MSDPSPPTPMPIGDAAQSKPPAGKLVRLGVWVGLLVAIGVGMPVWLSLLRGPAVYERSGLLTVGWLTSAGAMLGLWLLLKTTPPGAIKLSPRLGKRIILLLTAGLTASAIFFVSPVLERGPLRARVDGTAWLVGSSPYLLTPARVLAIESADTTSLRGPDPFAAESLAVDRAAPGQNSISLYPPATQLAFVVSRALDYVLPTGERPTPTTSAAPTSTRPGDWREAMLALPWWRQLFVWRTLMAVALLLTVAELIAWLRSRDVSVWWAAVFAWQPVVLVGVLGAGHGDLLALLFLVAGLRRVDVGRRRRGGLCLGAAAAMHPITWLAIPLAAMHAWRTIDAAGGRRVLAWSFAAGLLLTLPPLVASDKWHVVWPTVTAVFGNADGLDDNASLYWLLQRWTEDATWLPPAGWILAIAAAVIAAWIVTARRGRPETAIYVAVLAALLLGPTGRPSLLVWPLAMVPLLGGRGGLTACVWAATAVLAWGDRSANVVWQYAPVYAAALVEIVAWRMRSRTAARDRRRTSATAGQDIYQ